MSDVNIKLGLSQQNKKHVIDFAFSMCPHGHSHIEATIAEAYNVPNDESPAGVMITTSIMQATAMNSIFPFVSPTLTHSTTTHTEFVPGCKVVPQGRFIDEFKTHFPHQSAAAGALVHSLTTANQESLMGKLDHIQ